MTGKQVGNQEWLDKGFGFGMIKWKNGTAMKNAEQHEEMLCLGTNGN